MLGKQKEIKKASVSLRYYIGGHYKFVQAEFISTSFYYYVTGSIIIVLIIDLEFSAEIHVFGFPDHEEVVFVKWSIIL